MTERPPAGGRGMPVWTGRVAGAAVVGGVLAAMLLTGRNTTLQSRETGFLSAADTARSVLVDLYQRRVAEGRPAFVYSLSELGSNALPRDPLTGMADWLPVRNVAGAIIGVRSRSTARLLNPAPMAGAAHLCPGLPKDLRDPGLAAAWCFDWDPPATRTPPVASAPAAMLASRSTPIELAVADDAVLDDQPMALDALRARAPRMARSLLQPGALLLKVSMALGLDARRMPALRTRTAALKQPPLGAFGTQPPVARAAPALATVPAFPGVPTLPVRSAPPTLQGGRIAIGNAQASASPPPIFGMPQPAAAGAQVFGRQPAASPFEVLRAMGGAGPAPIGVPPAEPPAPDSLAGMASAPPGGFPSADADGSPAFSDDQATRNCQLLLGVDADHLCKAAKAFPDNGARYDACVQGYEARMEQCVDEARRN